MTKSKYEVAKSEADKTDQKIIATLKSGQSFLVEAGAGSGKTYSLMKVIEWVQANKLDYKRNMRKVICITYTNAAVEVIRGRLPQDSFIIPSTIHSFAWQSIKQYQSFLVREVNNNSNYKVENSDNSSVMQVEYTLGNRYIENGVFYLHHNDVLNLLCSLLRSSSKFRRIFSERYPLILIDEYQDTYDSIINCFVTYFIGKKQGPQFGFFGDSWQTIYQSNHSCGSIYHENLEIIKKTSNFRSPEKIVRLLNKLRPDLRQQSAIDDFSGEVCVITCEDYKGQRRQDSLFKNDLPVSELKARLEAIQKKIARSTQHEELKVLMLTHRVLASQQGYEKLFGILKNSLKDKEDAFVLFFMNRVEPIYQALQENDMHLLFDTLGVRRYPITKKSDKAKWKAFFDQLRGARDRKAIDVLKVISTTRLVSIPDEVMRWYRLYSENSNLIYCGGTTIRSYLDLEYAQFIAAINFLYPDSLFATEHGVKGEEYDNVVFVISRGWNQYQFEKYAPMIFQMKSPQQNNSSYVRNRNLFYVCCSRAKRRLFIFVTVPIDPQFKDFLQKLVGAENYYTYNEYLSKDGL